MAPTWKQILRLNEDTLSTEEKKNLAFMLLPVILGGRSKGKGGGRCTIKDSVDAFIDLKPAITNVEDYLQSIDSSERPQPYILALYTADHLKPSQHFLVAERRAVSYPSLLNTIDVAFKAHFVLDIKYQPQVKTVWEFLQVFIYDMPGAIPPTVRDFRAYLTKQLK